MRRFGDRSRLLHRDSRWVAPTKRCVSGSRSDKRPLSIAAQRLVPRFLECLLRLLRLDSLSRPPKEIAACSLQTTHLFCPVGAFL